MRSVLEELRDSEERFVEEPAAAEAQLHPQNAHSQFADGCMRKSVRLLHYGVVKVFTGLFTPSVVPRGSIESTV